MLEDIDRRLLRRMQADPTYAVPELAEHAGQTVRQTLRRLDKLRASGVIRGTRAVIDWPRLGYAVQVSLRFTLDKTVPGAFDEFIAAAREIPEVLEIQTFLGKVDVRLAVIARNMEHYQELYRKRILILPHIADIEALVHVATVKAEERLPV